MIRFSTPASYEASLPQSGLEEPIAPAMQRFT